MTVIVSMRCKVVAMVLLLIVALGTQLGKAQITCPTQLANLNFCAPFVVPGAPNTDPSAECYATLQATNHDCLCIREIGPAALRES
ncbi:hypothetical protein TSUD_44940 [Trifolium subterraneum]|nr:hypothetical protein TSUD_44940 [Trifolium subterraneum]